MTLWRLVAAPVAVALLMMLVLGVAYPLATWAAGRTLAPWQSDGSLLFLNGTLVGSELVAQNFSAATLFHPMPGTSSGQDPYVPIGYALEQVPRISHATGIPQAELRQLVYSVAAEDSRGVSAVLGPGYPLVNVVQLNYELMKLYPGIYGR
ncbi:MAG TPA: potassium-transporting ATPase subunit C [Nitrososphaeria archaeon]|nr:potassium-transporting ATPase subunit C [Conexivisphaerales archaeon]HEU16398.1 potassium-transporting ATPase subunit C [Nitrososphaeria archaeon]